MHSFRYVIVVPCHNEARRLKPVLFRRFAEAHPEAGLLFVDDGSTDGTAEVLAGFDVLRLQRNVGKAEAVRAGVLAVLQRGEGVEAVAFLDADLATPLEEMARLAEILAARPEVEMVLGSRWPHLGGEIQRSAARGLPGRVIAWAVRRILGRPVYDSQCGAKIFRRSVAGALFGEPFRSRWLFDVEVLLRLRGRAEEVPLRQWREVGGSKLGLGAMLRVPVELRRLVCYAHEAVEGGVSPQRRMV